MVYGLILHILNRYNNLMYTPQHYSRISASNAFQLLAHEYIFDFKLIYQEVIMVLAKEFYFDNFWYK